MSCGTACLVAPHVKWSKPVVVAKASTIDKLFTCLRFMVVAESGVVPLTGSGYDGQLARILTHRVHTDLSATCLVFKVVAITSVTSVPKPEKFEF